MLACIPLSPRSSGDRAPPSGGGSRGSNPRGGAAVATPQSTRTGDRVKHPKLITHPSGVALGLIVLFLATRALNVVIWQIPSVTFVQNDISYYGYWLWCLFGDGAAKPDCAAALSGVGVMSEYPLPAVWILQVQYTLGGGIPMWVIPILVALGIAAWYALRKFHGAGNRTLALAVPSALVALAIAVWFVAALPLRATAFNTWMPVFMATMLGLDALVAWLLYRHGSAGASVFWILFIGACGPIVWFRFDMLTAAAVALACLWLTRHPIASGALIGLGAAIKLWPAMLIAPMAGKLRLIGFAASGLTLGLASLAVGGWDRSISPMVWQSQRGLQMESVPATPLMILRTYTSDPSWPVSLSKYNAIEVFGPGVTEMLRVSTLLTIASMVLTVVLTWRLVRNLGPDDPRRPEAIVLAVLAVVLATIIANKTLSTQYIQWLAGPLAALIALRVSPWLRRPIRVLAVLFVLIAALTQYTYPWATMGIMGTPNGDGFATASLVARNIGLVLLTGFVSALAWRASARSTQAIPAVRIR